MIHLTIIRHGETIENAAHLCQGQQEGTLSELGVKQAKLLGEWLKNEPIDVFYSSDLKRTLDTSAEIIRFHPGLKLKADPVLRERNMSVWEGNPFPEGWHWEYLPDGAETNEDLIERAYRFLDEIIEKHDGKRVVAMTHGGLIRAMQTVLAHKPASEYFSWDPIKNTSVSRFELLSKGVYRVVEINNTDHLGQSVQTTEQDFS